jgi:hypothetical protein
MTLAADFRYCAARDDDHRRFQDFPDAWLNRYRIVVERAGPNPVMALATNYPERCPLNPDLDFRLKYWVVNRSEAQAVTDRAMWGVTRRAIALAAGLHASGVWGALPKNSQLRRVLDGWHERGLFDRIDGDELADQMKADDDADQASYHRNLIYYVDTMPRLVRPDGLLPFLERGP